MFIVAGFQFISMQRDRAAHLGDVAVEHTHGCLNRCTRASVAFAAVTALVTRLQTVHRGAILTTYLKQDRADSSAFCAI
jgi:hypothetical protein